MMPSKVFHISETYKADKIESLYQVFNICMFLQKDQNID